MRRWLLAAFVGMGVVSPAAAGSQLWRDCAGGSGGAFNTRTLGSQTVAEAVGDDRAIELLQGFGVDYIQGFHIGRPVPVVIPALP